MININEFCDIAGAPPDDVIQSRTILQSISCTSGFAAQRVAAPARLTRTVLVVILLNASLAATKPGLGRRH
jgi:hypothetical protein